MRYILVFILLTFSYLHSFAQSASEFKNSWIKDDQKYFKLKVSENGVYRVTYDELKSAGFPVLTAKFNEHQMYWRGLEVAILVHDDDGDNFWDAGDYIEFYGQKNEGFLDKELFQSGGGNSTNPYESLYGDATYYFLTVEPNLTQPKRIQTAQVSESGLGVVTEVYRRKLFSYKDNFSYGEPAYIDFERDKEHIYNSSYNSVKGYTATPTVHNNISDYGKWDGIFQLDEFDASSGGNFEVAYGLVSFEAKEFGDYIAEIEVSVGPSAASKQLLDTVLSIQEYKSLNVLHDLPSSNISSTGELNLSFFDKTHATLTPNRKYINYAPSYFLFTYPITDILNGDNSNEVLLEPSSSTVGSLVKQSGGSRLWVFADTDETKSTPIILSENSAGQFKMPAGLNTTSGDKVEGVVFKETQSVEAISNATFLYLNPTSTYDFLLVTHKSLAERAGSYQVNDVITEYVKYRESEAGGGHSVLLAYIDDLYNTFSYGEVSPLALREFSRMMWNTHQSEYLYLIGKGLSLNIASGEDEKNLIPAFGLPATDLGITFGLEGSATENQFVPYMAVGRLPARTPLHVANYLDKVKVYEGEGFMDLWKKKSLALAGGFSGKDNTRFIYYLNSLNQYYESQFVGGTTKMVSKSSTDRVELVDVTEDVNNGVGLMTFFGHSSSVGPDIEVGRVEQGYENFARYPVVLMNGCSGGNIYQNQETWAENWTLAKDRGAVLFMSKSGYALDVNNILLASNSYIYNNALAVYQRAFSDSTLVGKPFGKAVQEAYKEIIIDSKNKSDFNIYLSHVEQIVYQGDPAIQITADKPELAIKKGEVNFLPLGEDEALRSTSDSFAIEFPIYNYGKYTAGESVNIEIKRLIGESKQVSIKQFTVLMPKSVDTVNIVWDNRYDKDIASGANEFEIKLDYEDVHDEYDDILNNVITEVYNFPSNFNRIVYPKNFSVVGTEEITVYTHDLGYSGEDRDVYLEVFSPSTGISNVRLSPIEVGNGLAKWTLNLNEYSVGSLDNNEVFFIRTGYAVADENDVEVLDEISFTYRKGEKGWMQSVVPEFEKDSLKNVQLSSNGLWSIKNKEIDLEIYTSPDQYYVLYNGKEVISNRYCHEVVPNRQYHLNSKLLMLAIDHKTGEFAAYSKRRWNNRATGNDLDRMICGIWNNSPSVWMLDSHFKPNPSTRCASNLVAFMYGDEQCNPINDDNSIIMQGTYDPEDYAIILTTKGMDLSGLKSSWTGTWQSNYDETVPSTWSNYQVLYEAGIDTTDNSKLNTQEGRPYIAVVRRNARSLGLEADVVERIATDEGGDVNINYHIDIVPENGVVETAFIGPANSWESLRLGMESSVNDSWALTLSAINPQGVSLDTTITSYTGEVDLSFLNTNGKAYYSQLKLSMVLMDTVDNTLPQLKSWRVNYTPAPEGFLYLTDSMKQVKTEYYQGEDYAVAYWFENLSEETYLEEQLEAEFFNSKASADTQRGIVPVISPKPGERTKVEYTANTFDQGLTGSQNLSVTVGRPEYEGFFFNNTEQFNFSVEADKKNPFLDILFDGRRIMDGDIVAPNPQLTVSLKDDNPYLLRENSDNLNIYLNDVLLDIELSEKSEDNIGENNYVLSFPLPQAITNATASNGRVAASTLLNDKGYLKDSTYILHVEAQDLAGNYVGSNVSESEDDPEKARKESYRVSFTVDSKPSITQFYPYPNPFSDKVRFVFTLRGIDVPDEIKIQIMTVTGRIVREITQDELGPVHIGNNITEYAWDGRDEFGDQLANGVYLYRVFVRMNGAGMEHYETDGDYLFKKNIGKLYLMK
ncbi:C25 family cysteine peptidase [Limibacter armeniacum]|uniref:putative type IX secretion system sortase PorU2 n=1 Tax=Limibacter armeniacum TaxID=466084 RepID=UPI002FE64A83